MVVLLVGQALLDVAFLHHIDDSSVLLLAIISLRLLLFENGFRLILLRLAARTVACAERMLAWACATAGVSVLEGCDRLVDRDVPFRIVDFGQEIPFFTRLPRSTLSIFTYPDTFA